MELPAECGGLETLIGSEITAESLVGVVRDLSYAYDVEVGLGREIWDAAGTYGREPVRQVR